MDLQGKTAVVTGSGGGGCGRAIALRFAREGAAVVASDINEAGGLDTVEQIIAAGGKAVFRRADVSVQQQVRELIDFAENSFGHLDVLVNNASGPDVRHDLPLELWTETVQIELLGTMFATRFAVDALRRAGGGAIVNMSSITALWHGRKRGLPGYDSAKAGVLRLTTMLGWLGDENIHVNCLAPGWIAAPQVCAFWDPLTPEQRKQSGAPSRLLSLEEVAGAVHRLATDESLTGRVMVWWSEDEPHLIPWGDRGYSELLDC